MRRQRLHRSRRCRICTPRIVPPCRASPPPPCPALNSPTSPPPHSDGPPSPLQRLRPHPARRVPEPTRRRTSTTCTRIWQVSSGNCRSCAPKLPACNRSRRKAAPRRERGAASLRPIGHWARARAGHECIAEDGRVPYLLHAGRRAHPGPQPGPRSTYTPLDISEHNRIMATAYDSYHSSPHEETIGKRAS